MLDQRIELDHKIGVSLGDKRITNREGKKPQFHRIIVIEGLKLALESTTLLTN